MKILSVQRDKKHTVKVTFDNGKFYNFDLDYWNSACLHENDFLDELQLKNHLENSDYIRAKSRGMWFLDRSDYSEKILYEKICTGGISSSAAAKAVARLKELGLVNDETLACRLSERMSESGISKRECYAKLYTKGIPPAVIKKVLDETSFDEISQIETVIQKKYRTKISDKDNIQKIYAALVRKGFSYSAVREAIKKYTQEIEDYEEY